MAVDPESKEISMSTIAMQLFQIAGQGSYSIESDRYAHIDKGFLDKVKLGWVDPDYTAEYRKELLDEEIEQLIEERNQARSNRDFARSDEIRDLLKEKGILLEDTPQGTRWRREA